MAKWSKYAKRTFCMLLSAAMVLSDAGFSVSAAESTVVVETVEEDVIESAAPENEEAQKEHTEARSDTAFGTETNTEEISIEESGIKETATEHVNPTESVDSMTEETDSKIEESSKQETESEIEESSADQPGTEEKPTEESSAAESGTEQESTEESSEAESTVEVTTTEEPTTEESLTEEFTAAESETETEVQETEEQEVLAEDVIAQGEYKEDGNDITWVIDLDGKLTVTGRGDFAPTEEFFMRSTPWMKYGKSIKNAVIDVTGMTDATNMFNGCDNMTSVDLSKFDTSQIVSMKNMFLWCGSLNEIDLSGFDTSNVKYMTNMFMDCKSLVSLDLSSFDTSNVIHMGEMFYGCNSLTYLDMSSFDVSNADQEIDFAEGTGMEAMFTSCISLREIKTPRNVPESESPKLPNGTMWSGSDGNKYTELPKKAESIVLTRVEVEGVIAQGEYKEDGNDITWVIDSDGKLTVSGVGEIASNRSGEKPSTAVPWNDFKNCILRAEIHVQGMTNASYLFKGCNNLVEVDLTDFDTGNVQNMDGMFQGCNSLASLDLSSLNTRSVRRMNGMFGDCTSLESLNLRGFWTGNVIDMEYIFGCCYRLRGLNLSGFYFDSIENKIGVEELLLWGESLTQINTPNNLSISIKLPEGTWRDPDGKIYTELPRGIESTILTKEEKTEIFAQGTYQEDGNDITWTIDRNGKLTVTGTGDFAPDSENSYENRNRAPWKGYQQNIKTAIIQVTGMINAGGMFAGCRNLTTVDFSDFDTSQLISLTNMFSDCESLESVDLSNFNTENVQWMDGMFSGCTKLTTIDLSSFDTQNVTSMRTAFYRCKNLTNLDLSSFDTSNVVDMSFMFYGCSSLTNLDLSNFNVESVGENIDGFFEMGMEEMFGACISLKVIHTPQNVPEAENVQLPGRTFWVDSNDNRYTELPRKNESIVLTKEEVEGIIVQDTFGEIEWQIDTDGKLTVTGTGNVTDYEYTNTPQWYDYHEIITTAELNVKGMTDASNIFMDCKNLTSVDLSNFDSSNIMDFSVMFGGCINLRSIDLSKLNTSSAINMRSMFSNCSSLKTLDLSSFDTGNVENMNSMFNGCVSLENLDLSSFNTSKTTNMGWMFYNCINLKTLDLSSFDTSNVENMYVMFEFCNSLTSLDLSNFDIGNVTNAQDMFFACRSLVNLYTPRNVSVSVALPSYGTWYDIKGNKYTELPQNRSDSLLLARDERPSECITVTKKKTAYRQWDKIDTSDLTVKYHDSEGDVITLSASDYTTNADEIDTSVAGTQVLTVTYNGLTAKIDLTITEHIRTTVYLTGIAAKDYTYSKKPVIPTVLAETDDGTDVTADIKDVLVCTYTGKQADGTEYTASGEAPVNAGEYTLTATIPEDSRDYTGSSQTFDFVIKKAQVTITASDISLTTGAALPKPEDYKYTISAPATEEDLEKKPTLICGITDTSKEGTYDITVSGAALKANPNYEAEINYVNGKAEVAAYYTVTFDLAGKGANTTQTDIKKGSTISRPADPQAEGFIFTGWYKDKDCTEKWDFTADTVTSDTTLYAGWTAKDEDNKDDDNADDGSEDQDDSAYTSEERRTLASVSAKIAAIRSRVYDGTAYRPDVKVTAVVDGRKVTLTEGTDYRVLYKNNIKAGQATVTVKGNGIYKGELTGNYTIEAKPVNKLKVVTGGVPGSTAGSSIQNLPVYVYDGAALLKYGTDYTLSGYSAGKSSASVTITGRDNYTGTAAAKLTVYHVSGDKIINPEHVTLNVSSVAYTGKSVKNVEPTVKIGGTTLVKNKDYKVQYQNNKNAGTAFVIVTGKGAYKGKAVVPFEIKAASGALDIKPIPSKTYNGKLQKPSVTVTVNNKKLTKNKDYILTYKNNLHAGTATVIVTGTGNYAGMKNEAKFTINRQKISKASVKGTQGKLTLTYSKRPLKEGADYEKPIYGTAGKKKIKVTIKGKNDFTGEVTKSVKLQ